MKEIPTEIFCVYDKVLGIYWRTPKDKIAWTKSNHAKNAWNVNGPSREQVPEVWHRKEHPWSYWERMKFNEQDRYVIHKIKLNPEEAEEV